MTTTVKVLSDKQTIAVHRFKTGEILKLQALSNANYQLIDDNTGTAPQNLLAKRDGNNLIITLDQENNLNPDIIIENYYKGNEGERNTDNLLVGMHENGKIYAYVPESGEVADAVSMLAEEMVKPQALGGEELVAAFWFPWWLGGLAAIGGGIALIGNGGSEGGKVAPAPQQPQNAAPTGDNALINLVLGEHSSFSGLDLKTPANRDPNNEDVGAKFSDENGNDFVAVVIESLPKFGTLTTVSGGEVKVGDRILLSDLVYNVKPDFIGRDTFRYSLVDDGFDGMFEQGQGSDTSTKTYAAYVNVRAAIDSTITIQDGTEDTNTEPEEPTPKPAIRIMTMDLGGNFIEDTAIQDAKTNLYAILEDKQVELSKSEQQIVSALEPMAYRYTISGYDPNDISSLTSTPSEESIYPENLNNALKPDSVLEVRTLVYLEKGMNINLKLLTNLGIDVKAFTLGGMARTIGINAYLDEDTYKQTINTSHYDEYSEDNEVRELIFEPIAETGYYDLRILASNVGEKLLSEGRTLDEQSRETLVIHMSTDGGLSYKELNSTNFKLKTDVFDLLANNARISPFSHTHSTSNNRPGEGEEGWAIEPGFISLTGGFDSGRYYTDTLKSNQGFDTNWNNPENKSGFAVQIDGVGDPYQLRLKVKKVNTDGQDGDDTQKINWQKVKFFDGTGKEFGVTYSAEDDGYVVKLTDFDIASLRVKGLQQGEYTLSVIDNIQWMFYKNNIGETQIESTPQGNVGGEISLTVHYNSVELDYHVPESAWDKYNEDGILPERYLDEGTPHMLTTGFLDLKTIQAMRPITNKETQERDPNDIVTLYVKGGKTASLNLGDLREYNESGEPKASADDSKLDSSTGTPSVWTKVSGPDSVTGDEYNSHYDYHGTAYSLWKNSIDENVYLYLDDSMKWII